MVATAIVVVVVVVVVVAVAWSGDHARRCRGSEPARQRALDSFSVHAACVNGPTGDGSRATGCHQQRRPLLLCCTKVGFQSAPTPNTE